MSTQLKRESASDRCVFSAPVIELARILYESMEHLDPQEGQAWDALGDSDREYFCLCIRALLCHRDRLCEALSNNDFVNRRAQVSE
jgi:hypothetical protein